MSSTAEELSGQSEQLAEMIRVFIVNETKSVRAHVTDAQPKIAHVASSFQHKTQQTEEACEVSGKKDTLDQDFENF